jgi:hypothetical protein
MRFFFRRSLRVGPLRFNLSKRGVDASVGVRGARVGIDASGKEYVAGGRGGIYFRASAVSAPVSWCTSRSERPRWSSRS